jgi:hypothetical protein
MLREQDRQVALPRGPEGTSTATTAAAQRAPAGPRGQRPPGFGAAAQGSPAGPDAPPADPFTDPVAHTQRAVIGEALRTPAVWCDLTPCISRYGDPAALGVADVRARAVADGWRIDAFGRLTCPACQQRDTRFRATRAVVPWEREAALTMASLMVAGFGESQRTVGGFADRTEVIPAIPAASAAGG